MTMPVQFPSQEPPNSPVTATHTQAANLLPSSSSDHHLDHDPTQGLAPSASAVPAADIVALRQAGKNGEFRAIATLLNHTLQQHDIVAWVGEAGPGCLQITLTVKQPPQQKPLIRLIAHQLCLLQSDIIQGANITAQVAATNLILWHQRVRLPAPQPAPQPAQWQTRRQQAQAALQTSWQQGQTVIANVRPSIQQAWQRHWPQVRSGLLAQYDKVRSRPPFQPQPPQSPMPSPQVTSDQMDASAPNSCITSADQSIGADQSIKANQSIGITASQPNHRPEPEQPSPPPVPPANQATPLLSQKPPAAVAPPPTPSPIPTTDPQWTELAMLPVTWSPATRGSDPEPTDLAQSTATSHTASANRPATQSPTTQSPATQSPATQSPTPETPITQSPPWLAPLEQGHAQLMDYLHHPNYWVVGGVAIAVFAMGSGFEAVHQYFALQSRSPRHSAQEDPVPINRDLSAQQSQAPDLDTSGIHPPIIPADTPESEALESLESESPNLERADLAARLQQPERGNTVQTAVGEVDVVAIAPVTADPTTVTLTFSNDVIVPLPPPTPSEPPKWQWPFTQPPAPPISHPTDMAIALLNNPLQDAGDRDRIGSDRIDSDRIDSDRIDSDRIGSDLISPELLQQGSIDLVSLASNQVATAAESPLTSLLAQFDAISMPYIGIGTDKTSARQPQIFDIKGHRIAVLGYADTHLYAASDTEGGTNALSLGRLVEDLETIREQVDWVVITYHWHGHLSPTPTDKQIELAHLAIDHGADVVVGHHPSVMQGGEVYKGRAIAYSLGPIPDIPTSDSRGQNNEALPPNHEGTNVNDEAADASNTGIPEFSGPDQAAYTTALLKLEMSDRAMQVGFLPVYQDESGASFMAAAVAQPVFQAIEFASRSLTLPLSSNTMTHLPHNRDISSFSSPSASDPETSVFSPDSADSFIGPSNE